MFHFCCAILDIFEENETDEKKKYEKNYGLWGRPCSNFMANHQEDNFYNRLVLEIRVCVLKMGASRRHLVSFDN